MLKLGELVALRLEPSRFSVVARGPTFVAYWTCDSLPPEEIAISKRPINQMVGKDHIFTKYFLVAVGYIYCKFQRYMVPIPMVSS